MRNFTKILLVLFVIFSFSALTKAQNPISEEKRKLIAEMITLTKVDKQMSGAMDMFLKSSEESYGLLTKSSLAKQTNLSAAQRTRIENELIKKHGERATRFRERLKQAIDYNQYIQTAMYPLYDKFFTENELRDMNAFYKSPTGQKLTDTMPQLLAESVRLSQEILLPKISKIVDELINEDLKNLRQPPPPPRKKVSK